MNPVPPPPEGPGIVGAWKILLLRWLRLTNVVERLLICPSSFRSILSLLFVSRLRLTKLFPRPEPVFGGGNSDRTRRANGVILSWGIGEFAGKVSSVRGFLTATGKMP